MPAEMLDLLQEILQVGNIRSNSFRIRKICLNTSKVRMWHANFPEAIRFIRGAVVLTEKFGGKTRRDWMFQFILTCILLQSGEPQAALDLHLEVFVA
jgi:hypothetical protein